MGEKNSDHLALPRDYSLLSLALTHGALGHMRFLLRITSTQEPRLLEIPPAVVENKFLFGSDIPQRLEQNHMSLADGLAPGLHIRAAV